MDIKNNLLFIVLFIVLLVVCISIITIITISNSQAQDPIERYKISPPIINPGYISRIHHNDKNTFINYFKAVYPLLEEDLRDSNESLGDNSIENMLSQLTAGVVFWYYKVGNTDMIKPIQEYLGKYYSWTDMQKSGYEPPELNQLFSAPFTPPNIQRNIYHPYGWWNIPYYNGYPDNTYLECIHGTDTGSGYVVYGYWTYIFTGTGIYMNIGKSLRSHNKLHANYLLHYHQDQSSGLYNFLNLIIESASIGKGWKKDKKGYYTGELDESSIPPVSSNSPWTEPKYKFQVNNSVVMYLDQRACNNFGGPIPAGKQTNTKPVYKGYATKNQRQFANNLINKTLGQDYVLNTLKRMGIRYPIPDDNAVAGDIGIKSAIVYYILCAICTPDPDKNVNPGFYFYKDSGSIYWNPSAQPSDRQLWYWINTTSNTANFDRFITITAKNLGYDSVQFTAEPNGSGWLAFEFVYVGDKINWDHSKYPVKKVEKNWIGWNGINNISKIFNPFNPNNNDSCDFKQPQAMISGRCDNPWGGDRPLCSYICDKQSNAGIHRVVPQ